MTKCSLESPLVNNIFAIFLQVILTFVFLSIFFFSYVSNSEKDSFKLQMNIVVDDLAPDFDLRSLVPPGQEDLAAIMLDGSLELVRKNALKNSVSEEIVINKKNDVLKNKAYLWAGIAIGVLVLIVIILVILGYSLPFHIHLKEALITVFFVALTELIFLNIFSTKYWSVDPSQVRHRLGDSIQNWIQQHHPVETKYSKK